MMMLRDVGGLRGLGAFGDACPAGTTDDGTGNCVGSICPNGVAWDGTCNCPSGTAWNGTSCVNMASNCPNGVAWDGTCNCPDNMYWNGSACTSSAAVAASCPAGTVWVNLYGSCVTTCPAGMVYNASGACAAPNAGSAAAANATPTNSQGGSTVASVIAAIGAKIIGAPTNVPGAITVAPPTPWYSTPIGLLMIVGGVVGVYMLTKSPAPAPKAA